MKYNIGIISVLCLCGCLSGNTANTGIVGTEFYAGRIEPAEDQTTLFSEINLDDFEYVPPLKINDLFLPPVKIELSNEKNELLRNCRRLKSTKEHILLTEVWNNVVLFDKKGKYLRTVCTFNRPDNAVIDPVNGIIYILSHDKQDHCIKKYTLNGSYLGKIPLKTGEYERDIFSKGLLCDGLDIDEKGNLLIHYAYWDGNKIPYNYYLYSKEGKLLHSLKSMDKRFLHGSEKAIITEYNSYVYDNILHVIDASGKIFALQNTKFVPKYRFKSRYSLETLLNAEPRKPVRPMVATFVAETPALLLFTFKIYQNRVETFAGYYDKLTKKVYRMKGGSLFASDPVTGVMHISPNSGSNGKEFYSVNPVKQELYKLNLK